VLTALDIFIDKASARINRLPERSLVGLFWACASALMPEYLNWAVAYGIPGGEAILRSALDSARSYSEFGLMPPDAAALLAELEQAVPADDMPGDGLVTFAQDCWICADVGIRTLVDSHYSAGAAIWYALEPILHRTSEDLFGVYQVGGGPGQNAKVEVILAQSRVSRAIDFVDWATEFLSEQTAPSSSDLDLVRERAGALIGDN
jgi:hypothetical protein